MGYLNELNSELHSIIYHNQQIIIFIIIVLIIIFIGYKLQKPKKKLSKIRLLENVHGIKCDICHNNFTAVAVYEAFEEMYICKHCLKCGLNLIDNR